MYRRGLGAPLGVPVSLQMPDAGGCPDNDYPPSITFQQTLECAFLPFSDTCMALKRLNKAQCLAMSPPPPAAPPPPIGADQGGYISGTPESIVDDIITRGNQATLERNLTFFGDQAAANAVDPSSCAFYQTFNGETGECETSFVPVAAALAGVALLMLFR